MVRATIESSPSVNNIIGLFALLGGAAGCVCVYARVGGWVCVGVCRCGWVCAYVCVGVGYVCACVYYERVRMCSVCFVSTYAYCTCVACVFIVCMYICMCIYVCMYN